MGMTMTQKILAAHAGLDSVVSGQLIMAKLDMVLGNDITSPVAINEFEKAGFDAVFDKTKISLVMDHFVPNKDIKAAQQARQSRMFADKYDILNFYDVGEMGIEHADVILHIIGRIGVDGALYKSMEFGGPGLASLSIDDRLCMANMAIEAGAKNGIFEVDDVTRAYMDGRAQHAYTVYAPDADAPYEQVIDVDLSAIRPTVAFPHLPENTKTIDEAAALNVKIDQVVIGSCTNGRLSDMAAAAAILKGRKVARRVRAIIIPATQHVYKECLRLGYMDTFIDAGCVVSTPTCGPCLGGYMGVLAEGERCVATTNRNFVGRMGHTASEVYLASPAVAAASAIAGHIASPETV